MPPLQVLRIISPEGFSNEEMAKRVAAVHGIAIRERGVTPRITRSAYENAIALARPPKPFLRDWQPGSMEGFLFPAGYEFTQQTTAKKLVADQLTAFRRQFARIPLKVAARRTSRPTTSSRSPR